MRCLFLCVGGGGRRLEKILTILSVQSRLRRAFCKAQGRKQSGISPPASLVFAPWRKWLFTDNIVRIFGQGLLSRHKKVEGSRYSIAVGD